LKKYCGSKFSLSREKEERKEEVEEEGKDI
jgi:hypothetical protein